eukprot:1168267-Rhodomonas_salina.2
MHTPSHLRVDSRVTVITGMMNRPAILALSATPCRQAQRLAPLLAGPRAGGRAGRAGRNFATASHSYP